MNKNIPKLKEIGHEQKICLASPYNRLVDKYNQMVVVVNKIREFILKEKDE